jgi:hypothetical protein
MSGFMAERFDQLGSGEPPHQSGEAELTFAKYAMPSHILHACGCPHVIVPLLQFASCVYLVELMALKTCFRRSHARASCRSLKTPMRSSPRKLQWTSNIRARPSIISCVAMNARFDSCENGPDRINNRIWSPVISARVTAVKSVNSENVMSNSGSRKSWARACRMSSAEKSPKTVVIISLLF